jgi:hypothetical protein
VTDTEWKDTCQVSALLHALFYRTLGRESASRTASRLSFPSFESVRNVLRKSPSNKAVDPSGLSWDIFKEVPSEYLYQLWEHMRDKWYDIKSGGEHLWSAVNVQLIPKKHKCSHPLNDFRPISILRTEYKLWASMLKGVLQDALPDFEGQYAHRKGWQCQELTLLLTVVLEGHREHAIPLIAVFGDVEAAFDTTDPSILQTALLEAGMHPLDAWSLMRELFPYTVTVTVDGVQSNPIEARRGLRQGCPLSALLWCTVLHHLLRQQGQEYAHRQHLVHYMGRPIPTLAFADDLVGLNCSWEGAQQHLSYWHTQLQRGGQALKARKIECIANHAAMRLPSARALVDNRGHELVVAESGVAHLGCWLEAGSEPILAVLNWVTARANQAFACRRAGLCSRFVHLRTRMKRWSATVLPAIMHAAANLPVTPSVLRRMRAVGRRHYRQMLMSRRRREEGMQQWLHRTTARAEILADRWGIPSVERTFLEMYHRRAGHMARLSHQHLIARMLRTQAEGSLGAAFRTEAGRPVGRPCTRWQDALLQSYGPGWCDHAMDRDAWKAKESMFIRQWLDRARFA